MTFHKFGILILTLLLLSCSNTSEQEMKPMPVIEVTAEDVTQVVGQFIGQKAVLVNVWATWCIPCVEEFPYIVSIRNEFKDDLEVVFISADFPEALERVDKFLADNQVYWQTYLKNDRDEPFIDAVWTDWTGALPATIVYTANGERVAAFERAATYDEFRELAIKAINNPQ